MVPAGVSGQDAKDAKTDAKGSDEETGMRWRRSVTTRSTLGSDQKILCVLCDLDVFAAHLGLG